MKTALLIILLASICLLHAGADIPVYPNIDIQKFAGTWYEVAYVLKDREPDGRIPFESIVEPASDGNAVLKYHYIQDGLCQMNEATIERTDKPGVFEVPYTTELLYLMDVDYASYHIVHVVVDNEYSLYLSSRTRGASDDVKRKFKTFAKTLGYNVKQIVYNSLPGKSQFGEMFEECISSIISIMVLQLTLPAN